MVDDHEVGGTMRKILLTAVACSIVLAHTARAQAADYPVVYNFPAGLAASVIYPTPPGANDWACRPTAAHPRPVVLVPGLSGSSGRDWQAAPPPLGQHGQRAFALTLRPHRGG